MALPEVNITPSGQILSLEDDRYLISAIADGNQNAFGDVYHRYRRQIYNYLRRTIQDETGAEDLLQEVFLAVWQGAGKFKHKSSVKTWIYRIAYKQSISWLRKHHGKSNPIGLESVVDSSTSPEEKVMSAIRNTQLKKAMANLAPKHRAVLELAFVQDMSYVEISEILNCPIGTVKSRMSYALRNLNQLLLTVDIDHENIAIKEK